MIVGEAELDGNRFSAIVVGHRGQDCVTWKLPAPASAAAADALLATALLPAMSVPEPLQLRNAVSSRLLRGVAIIQDVFTTWARVPGQRRDVSAPFRRVDVMAPERSSPQGHTGDGVACFFTGGVDSFYTVLKHASELDAIVFVHGFDVPLDAPEQRERVSGGLRRAAGHLGLPLIEVETDLRRFSDRYVDWIDYHGAGLAGVAMLLAPSFHRVYVPASANYASLTPLGSHPLVDPWWSTEQVELVHDGCEATRLDKIEALGGNAAAAAGLRVCAQAWTGTYNCGKCEKCRRTMVAIRALGLNGQFSSLPALDTDGLREIARSPAGWGQTWSLALARVEREGTDPELAHALLAAVRRRRLRELARPVASRSRTLRTRVRRGFRRHG